MFLKRGKRGSEQKLYFVLWEIIAWVMVTIVIIMTVRAIVNNSSYWKKYYSTDLASVADLETTNNGDFIINYKFKQMSAEGLTKIYFLSDKTLETDLMKDSIQIYDYPKDSGKLPTTFPYAMHKNIDVKEKSTLSNFLVLSKHGATLTMDNYNPASTTDCPSYATHANFDDIKIQALPLQAQKTVALSTQLNVMFSQYGRSQVSKNAMVVFVSYDTGNTPGIYYPTDKNYYRGMKLSCILAKKFYEMYGYQLPYEGYDGFLDDINNPEHSTFYNKRDDYPLWIILKVSDTELSKAGMSDVLDKTVQEYYR